MTRWIVTALLAMHTAMVLAQVAGTNNPLPGTQEDLTEGDYTYRTNDAGQAAIIAFNKNYSGELLITNSLGGRPVTAIGQQAFLGHVGLISVTIPDSVTCIGEMAFSFCSNLVSLTIPAGITNIGFRAFSDCTGLTNLPVELGSTQTAQPGNQAYLARRRQRQLQQEQAPATKYTGEELEKHLQNYQMDVIRQGLPAHPIPLTKEMDDRLAKEGVLPPAGGGPYEPIRYKAPTNTPPPRLDNRSETNN